MASSANYDMSLAVRSDGYPPVSYAQVCCVRKVEFNAGDTIMLLEDQFQHKHMIISFTSTQSSLKVLFTILPDLVLFMHIWKLKRLLVQQVKQCVF